MAEPIETYRGIVNPWETDVTEHFTIAYYFDRIAHASAGFLERAGSASMPALAARRYDVRFARELRAGDGLHIESGVIEATAGGMRVGHRLIHSATAETATWFEERLEPVAGGPLDERVVQALASQQIAWDGPPVEARPEPAGTKGFMLAARDRVKPGELDGTGRLALPDVVHRFSAAALQALAAMGMDASYMQASRRGYSTFELQLRLARLPGPGRGVDVRTAIVHLGSSSVRILHRMVESEGGGEIATLGQFGVHLDLDARRPAPLPPALRERAAALLAAP